MSFVPWATHGIELHAFIVCKMSKSMQDMWPYIEKSYVFCFKVDISVKNIDKTPL